MYVSAIDIVSVQAYTPYCQQGRHQMPRTKYDKQLLTELANGFAYQCVRQSPLWTRLQNREVDAAAEELAQVLIQRAEEWTAERAGKLEKEQLAEVMA